jgi:hypothetical protein
MASSSEAFERLLIWKNARTWLNVTVIERGSPEHKLYARVVGVDEGASLVGLVGEVMHSFWQFDIGDAEFSIEADRLVVSRDDLEWLIFEVAES